MGLFYLIAALIAVARFAARRYAPLATAPAVTMLKPVCGADPELYENLLSFSRQTYAGPIQVVIGAHRENDPAVPIARRLIRERPDLDIELVIDGTMVGTNFKICNLANMMAVAKHGVLVMSDSDMRVGPDYLTAVVEPLLRPGVGIATTLYKAKTVGGFASRLAAGFINYGFLPSVLVGRMLRAAPFCSGSTIAIRRETLDRIGGFRELVDKLADDYALGALVRGLGLSVALSRYVVENVVYEPSLLSLFQHELRWQRTVKSITPLGLASSVITNPVALALAAIPFLGFTWLTCGLLAGTLAARLALIYICDRIFDLTPMGMMLAPLREVLSQLVLAASYCGQRVTWRNARFQVGRSGTLILEGDELA
jgi:ceramide glucosyltransferase